MLEVDGLSVRGGPHVVQEARFRVAQGGIHVLLGPTGSGKSLLLEGIAGLRPATGRLRLGGRELQGLPPESRGLAYVPQDLLLFPHLHVRDNVRFAARLRGPLTADAEDRIQAVLDRLGIAHLEDRWPAHLSGGERQRVALARALAAGCALLLLDEPFAFLNETLRRELWVVLAGLREELAILLVTHDLEEAFFLGDTISVLVDGVIHQTAPKAELHRRPATGAVARYLGIKNLFPGRVEESPDGHLRVSLPALGAALRVEGPKMPVGSRVLAGIRSEDVKIIPPGPEPPHHNAFTCRVAAVFDRVSAQTVHLNPEGTTATLEVDLGARAFARLGITLGAPVRVAFRPDQVFLVPEEATPS